MLLETLRRQINQLHSRCTRTTCYAVRGPSQHCGGFVNNVMVANSFRVSSPDRYSGRTGYCAALARPPCSDNANYTASGLSSQGQPKLSSQRNEASLVCKTSGRSSWIGAGARLHVAAFPESSDRDADELCCSENLREECDRDKPDLHSIPLISSLNAARNGLWLATSYNTKPKSATCFSNVAAR